MPTRTNYAILETVYEAGDTVIYRAMRQADGQPVMIKTAPQLTSRQRAQLMHQYEMTKDLNLPGVIAVYDLDQSDQTMALITEDIGGQPLSALVGTAALDLATILHIAIALADTLDGIHRANIIHKDIKPGNIIVNLQTGDVKITDFGIATRLSSEQQRSTHPQALEGTLAYMAPEQTGRMNRPLDSRADLYAFGVTLYELLSGRVPFQTNDPLEMVHSHIARIPIAPQHLNAEIPPVLSDLVMKLLAKMAEDRYQTAYGVKVDLQQCLAAWDETGAIAPFPLAAHDQASVLQIPQTLYGREEERAALLAAFERVRHGPAEVFMVAGYSGIGKSSLVHEVQRPIAEQRGRFISGKFDQYKRNIPYAALLEALQDLLQDLHIAPPAQQDTWRDTIQGALGAQAQVLVDVLPGLTALIGPQPAVPVLGPTETQQRFHTLIQQFIQLFANASHPLVIFLDDLQWADRASLTLLQALMTNPATTAVLVIGAYRDNEVHAAHPLMLMLDDLEKTPTRLTSITLQPLETPHLRQLLADTLKTTPDHVRALTDMLLQKTDGNPFYVIQLLTSLVETHLIWFDTGQSQWTWDLEHIRTTTATENVVAFVAARIQQLPPATQALLSTAACVGYEFHVATLAVLTGESRAMVAQDLWPAISGGFVIPVESHYTFLGTLDRAALEDLLAPGVGLTCLFLHDRVQQAAYSLIPEADRPQRHLDIGWLLQRQYGADEPGDQLFAIVNHLNQGSDLITDPPERLVVARLNLDAAHRAKAAAAYSTAAIYCALGIPLLPNEPWTTVPELTFTLHKERAECTYLSGSYADAEALFKDVLDHASSRRDKAEVYATKLALYTNQGKFAEGIALGMEGLALYGTQYPEDEAARQQAVGAGFGAIQENLGGRAVEELLDAPTISDPDHDALLNLLLAMIPLTFNVSPNLMALVVLDMVNTSLKYGNSPVSAQGYNSYGVLLAAGVGDYTAAYAFGTLSVRLNERFKNTDLQGKIHYVFGAFIDHWKNHLSSSLTYLKQAYLDSLEIGDLLYAGFAGWVAATYAFARGEPLADVRKLVRTYLTFAEHHQNPPLTAFLTLEQQMIDSLRGRLPDTRSLSSDTFDEDATVAMLNAYNLISVLNLYYLYKAAVLYIHGHYPEAQAAAAESAKTVAINQGTYPPTDLVFYQAMVQAALYDAAAEDEQPAILSALEGYREQFRGWAAHGPANSQHRLLLITAEIARIGGQPLDALAAYDEAIEAAHTQQFLHHEALGYERAGLLYHHLGRDRSATVYLRHARAAYRTWGAFAKVQQLEHTYAHLLGDEEQQGRASTAAMLTPHTLSNGNGSQLLDSTTVMKAAQAIASELVLDTLLTRLMTIVVENAGAQKGCLILQEDGGLQVEVVLTIGTSVQIERPRVAVAASSDVALQVVAHVRESLEPLVLHNAARHGPFTDDPHIRAINARSVACLPLTYQGQFTGMVYLENTLASDVFTAERLELLRLLASQAAIALEHARLYAHINEVSRHLRESHERLEEANRTLEAHVAARTAELQGVNSQLQAELQQRAAYEDERERLREEIIRVQSDALAELSTPLIPITDHIMVMPLIGSMDTQRAQQMLSTVLEGTAAKKAQLVIIDITGVPVVDTAVAGMLLRAAQALQLLGAQPIISGIRPEVAQTLVGLGVDMRSIRTTGTLQSAIATALSHAHRQAGSMIQSA